MRPRKLWWWKAGKCWASKIDGRPRRLGDDPSPEGKARAERELHRLLSEGRPTVPHPRPSRPTVGEVVDRYNDHATATLVPSALRIYRRRLADFKATWGDLDAADVRPRHVNEWTAGKGWADSTRRTAIAIIRRAFAWATREGYLDRDPTIGVEKPPSGRRKSIPSAAVAAAILEASPTRQFREFLEAVARTGCRPGEAAKVTAEDFDPGAGTWTIRGKSTKKTGRMRVVYLPPSVVETCKRLATEHPTGPLYRNFYGRPWNDQAYGETIRRIRVKLGLGPEVVAYSLRHLFATDALERGVPIATVAELMGHASTAMISQYYSHLSDRASHLREAVGKIRPEVSDAAPGPPPDASARTAPASAGPPPSDEAPPESPRRKPRGRKP